MYDNGKMRPTKTVLKMGRIRKNDRKGKFK
jgi:hypothetical protein